MLLIFIYICRMNKKLLISLIILMSLSLTGIVAVQLFWIVNAFKVKDAEFERNVNKALQSAIKKLETRETMVFIAQQLDSIANNLVIEETAYITNDPPAKALPKPKQPAHTPSNHKSWKQNITIDIDKLKKEIDIPDIDSLRKPMKAIQEKYLAHDSALKSLKKEKKMHKQRVIKLNRVLHKMAFEFSFDDMPVEKRLRLSSLDSILRQELQNNGIKTYYEYAVVTGKNDSLLPYRSDGYQKVKYKDKTRQYKANLFPNDIFTQPYSLCVVFPSKNEYILQSLFFLLLGSLIFTVIILITFSFSTLIIMRQKKISDIKTDFINNMTHEFKTPIATISLASASIYNHKILNSKEKILYFAGKIQDANKRMNTLIENVLQMALLDKNELMVNKKTVEIHELLIHIIENMSIQVEKRKGCITTQFRSNYTEIAVDEMHFSNVIYNLLDNAIKYSTDAPEITISTEDKNHNLKISVTDKGMGMSKDVQKKIFDRFYRATTGNIHNIKGFGLGLSYVKAIVDAHKGTIEVQSEKGKGSVFSITVPANSV